MSDDVSQAQLDLKIIGNHMDKIIADRDRLAARVAELEAKLNEPKQADEGDAKPDPILELAKEYWAVADTTTAKELADFLNLKGVKLP